MDAQEEDIKIVELAYSAYIEEYREASEIWKTLENKAQVTITVAGVFLAAVFAFSRDANLLTTVRFGLAFTFCVLLGALLTALWVLRVATYDPPVDAPAVVKLATELIAAETSRKPVGSRYKAIMARLNGNCDKVIRGIDAINETKQMYLGIAYVLLSVAAFSATSAGLAQL